MEISEINIEELRFLTYPGSFGEDSFLEKDSDRYNNYGSLMDNNKLNTTDIMLIRDILLYMKPYCNELEDFLIDLFKLKSEGSLTKEVSGKFIKKYSDLFMELDEINRKMAPVIFFDMNKDYDFEFYKKIECSQENNTPCENETCENEKTFINNSQENTEISENEKSENDSEKIYHIDENKTYYCGFHKYLKAAVLLRKNLAIRLDKNKENYKCDKKYENAIEKAIKNMDNKPCLEQKVAIATAMINNSFSIISGGPGTGKTTVVFSLLNCLYNMDKDLNPQDIVLLAPTGRAAGRIEESVKEAAEKLYEKEPNDFLKGLMKIKGLTIHKYLQTIDLKEKDNKKTAKIVIVDEVSMVDIYIMSSLLNNLSPDTRLILVGDYNQLPSVEAGCVMADLSKGIEDFTLTELVKNILHIDENDFNKENERNEVKSNHPMGFVADLKVNHRANVDELKKSFIEIENDDTQLNSIKEIKDLNFENGAYLITKEDGWEKRSLVDKFLEQAFFANDNDLGKSYIEFVKEIKNQLDFSESVFALDSKEGILFEKLFKHINKYRVLCPNRSGRLGCERINANFLKAYRKKMTEKNDDFALGQPIMVVKNDYKLNVSNGDNGIVLCDKKGMYKIVFKIKDCYVAYLATNFEYFENSFAITVHKSQGSEYDNIIVPIEEASEFITKELLYTALTRAKKSFVLLSDKDTVKKICKNKINRQNHYDLYKE